MRESGRAFLPAWESGRIGPTEDDISLRPADGGDPRTPDIMAQPNVGVVYTGSLKFVEP